MPAPNIKFELTTERELHTEGSEALAFCLSDDFTEALAGFPAPIAHVIQQAIDRQLGTGALSMEMFVPTMGLYPIPNLIVYYNKDSTLSLQRMRELGAHTARFTAQHHLKQITIELTTCHHTASSLGIEACVGAWTEGIGLGSYTIQTYRNRIQGHPTHYNLLTSCSMRIMIFYE